MIGSVLSSVSERGGASAPRPGAAGNAGRGQPGRRLSRAAARLLEALAGEGTSAAADPTRDDGVIVAARSAGVSLGRGTHGAAALRELADHDLVEPAPDGGGGPARRRTVISAAGRARLRREEAGGTEDSFAAQHRDLATVVQTDEHGTERRVVNTGESPLEWLRRRRDRDGEPLIDAAAFEAGERFRRDLTSAAMLPGVTARWDGAVASGRTGPRDPAGASDAVVAARQRVRRAMVAVGGDFADLLVDLCGFLKGLERIERDRRWPTRSAKVVVRLALRQLARHYGLETEARGPAASKGLRSWQADPTEPG